MNPVGAADHHQAPVFAGPFCGSDLHFADSLDQQVGGIPQLPSQRGVENVGGSQSLMNPTPGRTHVRSYFLKKGENIVPGAGLVFLNLAKVELGPLANGPGILGGDDFFSGHALAGQDFNLQPASEFGFFRPNSGHGRAGIAGDHRTCRVLILKRFFKNSVPTYSVFLRKNRGRA